MMAACAAAAMVMFSPGTAGADETSHSVPTEIDAGVLASPKCSGTLGHGVILYQVCFQYNCDSNSCYHRGYLGLINNATSARTVTWDLDWSRLDLTYWNPDDSGQVTLAAGQQQTIFSDLSVHTLNCNFTAQRRLSVGYDSSGMSAFNHVSDYLACV